MNKWIPHHFLLSPVIDQPQEVQKFIHNLQKSRTVGSGTCGGPSALVSLHSCPVGLRIQTKVSREGQGKDVAQVSATLSHLPWHGSESCCSGFLWVFSDEAGAGCAQCVRESIVPTATHSSYILSRSDTMACAPPDDCNRKAPPNISHSLSPSFPLPGLGTTAREQWEHAHVDILPGQLMLCPTKVTGKAPALPQTFCTTGEVPEGQAGSEHRWGSYPIPVQTPSGWLSVCSFGLLAALSLCLSMCCVGRE